MLLDYRNVVLSFYVIPRGLGAVLLDNYFCVEDFFCSADVSSLPCVSFFLSSLKTAQTTGVTCASVISDSSNRRPEVLKSEHSQEEVYVWPAPVVIQYIRAPRQQRVAKDNVITALEGLPEWPPTHTLHRHKLRMFLKGNFASSEYEYRSSIRILDIKLAEKGP